MTMTGVHSKLAIVNITAMEPPSIEINRHQLLKNSQTTDIAPLFGNLAVLLVVVTSCVVFGLTVIVWFCCVTLRHRRHREKDCEYGSLVKFNNSQPTNWTPVLLLQGKRASEPENNRCIPFSVPMTASSNSSLVQSSDFTHQSRSSLNGSGSLQGNSADDSSSQSTRSGSRISWTGSCDSADKKPEVKGGHLGVGGAAFSLGSIDPSLYRTRDDNDDDDVDFPEGHIGRIRFSVQYNRESEKLLVTLIAARNLPSRVTGTNNSCDPFVRICLLPDTRSHVQTKFKKKICNPKFDENFVFQVSVKNLSERVLKLTVYDVDRLRRHNVIGHVLYPLKGYNYETSERCLVTRDLELEVPENALEKKGELHVSLSYNDHTERLTVGIFEGKELKKYSENGSSDYYIKVCLMRNSSALKTKKTEIVRQDSNPKFNESFVFKLSPDILDTASVILSAWNSLSGQRDKSIGRIVLGSFMFARGKELQHWNEAIAHSREQISYWHVLV